ncbi:hypothetical protein HK102_011025 [Quaeritorhiza haematococci]|nr:hypothetical protein HK102_011025 [Quaeritorhiza haematococci]
MPVGVVVPAAADPNVTASPVPAVTSAAGKSTTVITGKSHDDSLFAQPPPLPAKSEDAMTHESAPKPTPKLKGKIKGRNRIFVIKKMPSELMSEVEPAELERHTVPISLVTTKYTGPRKTKDGRIIEHSLLGDADDFEEMEQLYGHTFPDSENGDALYSGRPLGEGELSVRSPVVFVGNGKCDDVLEGARGMDAIIVNTLFHG